MERFYKPCSGADKWLSEIYLALSGLAVTAKEKSDIYSSTLHSLRRVSVPYISCSIISAYIPSRLMLGSCVNSFGFQVRMRAPHDVPAGLVLISATILRRYCQPDDE